MTSFNHKGGFKDETIGYQDGICSVSNTAVCGLWRSDQDKRVLQCPPRRGENKDARVSNGNRSAR